MTFSLTCGCIQGADGSTLVVCDHHRVESATWPNTMPQLIMMAAALAEKDAEIARLREAVEALGVIGDGYCFCHHNRDERKDDHEPECDVLRKVLEAK